MVAAHYKKDDLLHCWTSSSDISGYHVDFHEGLGTIGAGQGRGMAYARHAMCESAFIILYKLVIIFLITLHSILILLSISSSSVTILVSCGLKYFVLAVGNVSY